MPVQIDTITPRLTSFEDHVLAELMRLQCREAELVATINELQQQIADRDRRIAENDIGPLPDQIVIPAPFRDGPIKLPE